VLRTISTAVLLVFLVVAPQSTTAHTADSPGGLIAFVGIDHNIWLIGPDASNGRAITQTGPNEQFRAPHWSADGTSLTFLSVVTEGNTATVKPEVYRNGAAEAVSAPHLPIYDGGYSDIGFSLSGDGYVVAHWSWPVPGSDPSTFTAVGFIPGDGSDERQLLSYADMQTILSPNDVLTDLAISPSDGRLLLTTFNVLHQRTAFLTAGLDGPELSSWWLAPDPTEQSGGVGWAAGGVDILAARCATQCAVNGGRAAGQGQPAVNQQADLVQVGRDGHVQRVLATLPSGGTVLTLTPAPDGSAVAFAFVRNPVNQKDESGPGAVYVVKIPGGSPAKLADGSEPSWQPLPGGV
jgi:hypothetical protein